MKNSGIAVVSCATCTLAVPDIYKQLLVITEGISSNGLELKVLRDQTWLVEDKLGHKCILMQRQYKKPKFTVCTKDQGRAADKCDLKWLVKQMKHPQNKLQMVL